MNKPNIKTGSKPATTSAAKPTERPKGRYGNVSGAKPQRASNYLRPGHYVVQVSAVKEDTAFKKGDFVAVEMRVVHVFADSTPGYDYARKADTPCHSLGEEVSDIMMVSNVAFEQRLKAFVMNAGGLTEEDFANEEYPGQLIEAALGDEQPIAGTLVELRCETVVKKDARDKAEADLKNENIYTRPNYVRTLAASELLELAQEAGTENTIRRLISNLDEMIEAESAE